jgi:hypothetical protein
MDRMIDRTSGGRKLSSMGGKKKRGQTVAELQRAIFIKKK